MPLSATGLQLLIRLEGSSATPYRDSAGLLTIGCGHLLTQDELHAGKIQSGGRVLRWKDAPLTEAEIAWLLTQDVAWAETAVATHVAVALTQPQEDALVCFAFNIGAGAFAQSTLCRLLNTGHYEAVPEQLRRWCHAGGAVVAGLQARREAEIARWLA